MYYLAFLFYNLVFPVLFLLYLPFYLRKLTKRGNFKEGFYERFGMYTKEKRKQLESLNQPIWVHAVSVGETVAAISLLTIWKEKNPDLHFVISTTTSTGQAIARKRAPKGTVVVYFPLDILPCIAGAFRTIKPRMLMIFEVEIWPNIIRSASRRGIPLSLVNCRMSDNSAAGYSKHSWFFRRIFNSFNAIAVQTEEDARRVEKVLPGTDKVQVCGTMKFDQVADREGEDIEALLDRVFPKDRMVYIAASTHNPEEQIMARATKELQKDHPNFRMVLVPRHQERADEVEAVLKAEGVNYILLTDLRGRPDDPQVDILVVNTTGELMNFLAGGDIVYVGKSLGDYGNDGGHNIIEPAIFGKPILHGPEMHNFRDVVRVFQEDRSAIQVADEADFMATMKRLLANPEEREKLGKASRATVDKRRGAIARTIEIVSPLCGLD